jgi:putative peptidoglycan lipid II flippase
MGRLRSIVAKANRRLNIRLAAILLASSTMLSSLLGLFRDRLLNSMYYATYPAGIDAYTVAFTVPDFMYYILVTGALSVSFIPVFNQRLANGNKKSAWELSTSMINFMALITMVASILIVIFADPLVRYVVGPGLDESSRALAISMMRVIAINPFLFAIATVISSMQQAVGRFTFNALAPTIYNIGIIIGAEFFTRGITIFGWHIFDGGIMGVALGVVLGSIMQLIVSSIGLIGLGFDYEFKIYWKNKGFLKVLTLLPARSFNQGIDYVNEIVETNLASRMASGVVRAYQQATTLHMVPVNLIGVAISTAAFPKMTERISQGRPDLYKKELQIIIRTIIWLALPVSVIVYFARGYIVAFINNGGDYLMSGILGILAIAILFRSIYQIAARSFYAHQDTKTPLYISILSFISNVSLAIWFTMKLNMGAYGLALASIIVSIMEVVILFVIMTKTMHELFDSAFRKALFKMIIASVIVGFVSYITVLIVPLTISDRSFFSVFPKFMLVVLVSLSTYVAISKLFKIEEVDPILHRIKDILFWSKK